MWEDPIVAEVRRARLELKVPRKIWRSVRGVLLEIYESSR